MDGPLNEHCDETVGRGFLEPGDVLELIADDPFASLPAAVDEKGQHDVVGRFAAHAEAGVESISVSVHVKLQQEVGMGTLAR